MGPIKTFFDPKTLFGLRNPNFGGVILLKLFDLSNGLGARNYQNSHFWAKSVLDISKTAAWNKKFRSMTPPKLGFLRPNKVFGVKKKVFRGPTKWKKLIFSKNLSSRICPKVDSYYPRGTCENLVYHFHVTIQIIITSHLRPVVCNQYK